MAATKVKKRSTPGAAAAALAASAAVAGPAVIDRCNNGDEITNRSLLVPEGVSPEVNVEICGSPASLVVSVDGEVVYSQGIVDSFRGRLGLLAPGEAKLLLVTLLPLVTPWRIQTEASASGAVGYRHRKSDTSGYPHPKFAVLLKGVA